MANIYGKYQISFIFTLPLPLRHAILKFQLTILQRVECNHLKPICNLYADPQVTSVSWSERGNYVAVGTHRGYVQVWDVAASKRVNCLEGHSARVGALAWNGDMLSSGSRDRMILQRDVRTPAVAPERKLVRYPVALEG